MSSVQELTMIIYSEYTEIWQEMKKYFLTLNLDKDENDFSIDFYYSNIYLTVNTNNEFEECKLMLIPFYMLYGLFDEFFRKKYKILLNMHLLQLLDNFRLYEKIFKKYEFYQQKAILKVCEEIKRKGKNE